MLPNFDELHERHAPAVYSILLGMVPARECEDLLQEVFLQAFRKIDSLRDPAAFGGWVCTIARNKARDHHRRHRPVERLDEDIPSNSGPADTHLAAREALEAIRELPDAYRETLMMRLVEGLSGPEIAEATGLTPGSVRVNLHRGMKLLRKRLEM